MKIGVNARFLNQPYTGIGQYTRNLFQHIGKFDKENEYLLLVPGPVDFKFSPNIKVQILAEKKLWPAGLRKTFWEQIQVPAFLKKEKVDTAFFPYPANPWRGFDKREIVTVHDTIPWKDKRYRPGILSKLYNLMTRNAVKKADLVLTVSGESMKDIVRFCEVEKEKIEVVYNDVSGVYKEELDDVREREVLHRFNIKKNNYFLYVGGYDLRKNVDYLVKEYESAGLDIPLVLAGGKAINKSFYNSYNIESLGDIVRTGFLEEVDLAILYKNCRAFINMSQMEGFNLPILEAANCGAALILSDIPVHREVAEDKAIFVKLKDGELKRILRGLEERELNFKREEAKKLAKKYDMKKYARMVQKFLTNKDGY